MTDLSRTVELDELVADPDSVLEVARNADGPVVVTREARPWAVLMDVALYRRRERERELLRRLALGDLEAAAGEGDELEAVLADCRMLLEES